MTHTALLSDDAPTEDARAVFDHALLSALTEGRLPGPSGALGVNTLAAIEAVARDHPEAAAELINDAYDAFQREFGVVG